MLCRPCKFSEVDFFSVFPSGNSVIFCVKQSEILSVFCGSFCFNVYIGSPFFIRSHKKYTCIARFIIASYFSVKRLLLVVSQAEIFKTIIRWFSIDVIYEISWPLFSHKQPSYTVGFVIFGKYRYYSISSFVRVSGFFPKLSCFRIISKACGYLFESRLVAKFLFLCFVWRSHSTLLRSLWSEAGSSASNAYLPRCYIGFLSC